METAQYRQSRIPRPDFPVDTFLLMRVLRTGRRFLVLIRPRQLPDCPQMQQPRNPEPNIGNICHLNRIRRQPLFQPYTTISTQNENASSTADMR